MDNIWKVPQGRYGKGQARATVLAWLGSPGHRASMLDTRHARLAPPWPQPARHDLPCAGLQLGGRRGSHDRARQTPKDVMLAAWRQMAGRADQVLEQWQERPGLPAPGASPKSARRRPTSFAPKYAVQSAAGADRRSDAAGGAAARRSRRGRWCRLAATGRGRVVSKIRGSSEPAPGRVRALNGMRAFTGSCSLRRSCRATACRPHTIVPPRF